MIESKYKVDNILEIIATLLEASEQLYSSYQNKKFTDFNIIYEEMIILVEAVYNEAESVGISKEMNIGLHIKNVLHSLKNLEAYYLGRNDQILNKIEFELISLLQETYSVIYFIGINDGSQSEKEYYEKEMIPLCSNQYINNALKTGTYKYELSIIVIGYNKLEYTTSCVKNLLNNIPRELNYELILANHGSSDETKKYFESIRPTKQINLKYNGGGLGCISRIVEGKYSLVVSNDVIITENAIANLLKCIESDEDIAWVVPVTTNISNLQGINDIFGSMEEVHDFAKKK